MKLFKGKTVGQVIALSFGLASLFAGLILTVLGLIGDYGPHKNVFKDVSDGMVSALHFGLTLTWLGVFFLLLGALVFALALSFIEKNDEREEEKRTRRKQRLEAIESRPVVSEVKEVNSTVNEEK